MESYEEFIQRVYNSHYANDDDEDDDDDDSQTPSSVIVFRGSRVLPPLLNEHQRDEMRRLREAAVSLMKRRSEEESHSCFTDARISDAERDAYKSDDIISSAPLTSIARSANQPTASPEDESLCNSQITVLFEGFGCRAPTPDHHSHSQMMMMMMSSGYVTNDNTDVTCHSSWIEGDGAGATHPTTTGSDIISHAPVDGALLEEEEEEVEDVVLHLKTVTELVNPASDPDEGPYRMSLQNLLKKSQEYRRHQRQARALKLAADEHSLSDKENEELLPKHVCKTELRKAREKRKETTDHLDDLSFHDTLPQATSTSLPVTARSLCDSKQRPLSVSRSSASKRFTSIPTPKFCRSPVRSTKKSSGIPGRKAVSESKPSGPAGGMMSEQTEQITQLELNLSSLKALISDLESTLTLSQTHQTGSPTDNGTNQPSTVTFNDTLLQEDCGISQENLNSVAPIQAANHSEVTSADEAECSVIGSSYDVDAPSILWTQLTPETGGHEGVSRVKRRLLMNEGDAFTPGRETGRVSSSTPPVMSSALQEDHVTALMEEKRRRQQELLQSLAVRYQFLRSVSFPCPGAGSRLEDTSTSLLASSVCTHTGLTDALLTSRRCCLSLAGSCRPLLAALARGFLTRRLLRTERVARLIRTIKDTRMFLLSFQRQTAGGGARLDLMLQERVTLQLRAARHDLHQIFFSSSSSERMHMIHCDRELRRDRRPKPHDHKAKGFLSAATRKALERKKLVTLQGRSADRKSSPPEEEKWNLVPKVCRVSKRISAR